MEVPHQCETCGSKLQLGGPIWNEKIHNLEFVEALHAQCEDEKTKAKFGTVGRIRGVLGGIIDEEWLAHKPLSYDLQ